MHDLATAFSAFSSFAASCPPLPQPPLGPSPPPAAAAAAPPTTSGQLRGCGLRQTSAVSAAPLLCHPRPSSPSARNSGTPSSANLGSLRFSSSFEAWLNASIPVSSFRLPLLFLTLTSGHCRSSLRRLLPGDQLEAGPRGPGVRREGAAFGRRTVRRQRSHLGLNKGGWGYCACAEVGALEGEGVLGERSSCRRPPLRAGAGWSQTPRWATGEWLSWSFLREQLRKLRSAWWGARDCLLRPVPGSGTGPGHQPHTGRLTRRSPGTGSAASSWRAASYKNYPDDLEDCSYGQLVIGSFIMTAKHLLIHHVLCRVFWRTIKSPR
ncbi:uncharacterized protein [Desmodus rotundus]|uniref:uncharacterized protein n=1 Tax=Desmodus rotundus TaxID=9430 RepID=UPI002380F7CE|nr:uncharacterized protein LOC123478001 [Desmodus rotundus]